MTTGLATCYRVLMLEPETGLHWQPIIVAEMPAQAAERAQIVYPTRSVVDVAPLHLCASHGMKPRSRATERLA